VPKRVGGASGATGYRKRSRIVGVSHTRRWPGTGRLLDILNMPITVLGVLFVVAAVNVFLYFGYSSNTPTPLPTERTAPSATTLERTERAGPKERTLLEVTRPERTRPSTTLQSTTPTEPSATVSATASPSP
jgi:hypothetical protein